MEDNFGYFLAAYIVILVVLFTYIYRIYSSQRKLKQDMDSLKEELRNKRKG